MRKGRRLGVMNIAESKQFARQHGWTVRFHKPKKSRPYYSVSKPGQIGQSTRDFLRNFPNSRALEHPLDFIVRDAIKREESTARWEAERPMREKMRNAVRLDPNQLDTPETRTGKPWISTFNVTVFPKPSAN